MGGWLGGNQVDNHATLWSNLQNCKISSKVEIPKLDPSVALLDFNLAKGFFFKKVLPVCLIFTINKLFTLNCPVGSILIGIFPKSFCLMSQYFTLSVVGPCRGAKSGKSCHPR